MIQRYNKKNQWLSSSIVDLTTKYPNDFYITKNNIRHAVKDEKDLNILLNQSTDAYYSENNDDIDGMVLVWKSVINDSKRYYVKLVASSKAVAKKLLTVLVWNSDKDLWIKIDKQSPYLSLFLYNKIIKFDFYGDRGSQLLLHRKRTRTIMVNQRDKSDDNSRD